MKNHSYSAGCTLGLGIIAGVPDSSNFFFIYSNTGYLKRCIIDEGIILKAWLSGKFLIGSSLSAVYGFISMNLVGINEKQQALHPILYLKLSQPENCYVMTWLEAVFLL
jgi:hypothetical protein